MNDLLMGLRAAAEPTRLRLLVLCAQGELTVSELTDIVGQSQPRVSRHLKLLCDAGLLDRFREGTWVFYRLAQRARAGELARLLVELVPDADADATLALDRERLAIIKHQRAAQATAYFRANAAQWDRIRSLYVAEREVEGALQRLLPADGLRDLLDVGTGTGRMMEIFGPQVERAVGVDLSREMLAVARVNLERANLRNCSLRQADMYQLPLPGASFDAIVIHQVLHYAERPAQAIAEAARVLRPQGRLVIVDFAPHDLEFLRTEHAHRRLGFADAEVLAWCRAAGLEPAAHLTAVGAACAEIDEVAQRYWEAGIRHLVALRGDGVPGEAYRAHPGGYPFAAHLVAGLKRIADFELSVAAYPETHPEAKSAADDLDNLKRKIDAGANRAITQFFFEIEVYLRFVERATKAGINVPIVPGILPVTNFAQVKKFAATCGAAVPSWMAGLFDWLDNDPDTRRLVAASIAAEQCRRLQAEGVGEFHFYTVDRADLLG